MFIHHHLYIYLSIYLFIHLSIYPSIYLSIYLYIHLSIYLSYLYIYLSIYPSIYLYIHLSIYLSYLYIHLSIYPSLNLRYIYLYSVTKVYNLLGVGDVASNFGNSFCGSLDDVQKLLDCQNPINDNNDGRYMTHLLWNRYCLHNIVYNNTIVSCLHVCYQHTNNHIVLVMLLITFIFYDINLHLDFSPQCLSYH